MNEFMPAVGVDRHNAALHASAGEILLDRGLLHAAAEAFRKALTLDHLETRASSGLARTLDLLGDTHEAVGAWCSLGSGLAARGCLAEAAVAYREATVRKPDCLRALFSLGRIYNRLRQPHDAIHCFQQALAIRPNHKQAHRGLGKAFHLIGNMERGWEEFASYSRDEDECAFEQPLWDGSPLEGRTILLWPYDGLGDTIQCLRYIPHVQRQGGHVVVVCDRILLPLVTRLAGVDRVIATKTPLPWFDVHAPLWSLPRLFQERGDSVGVTTPYLTADDNLVAMWRHRLASNTQKTVGLVWTTAQNRGDSDLRSIPAAALSPLACVSGVRFIGLRPAALEHEGHQAARIVHVEQLLDESHTLADTAAIIANLDLTIAVDTLVAHLAGALGTPVWTLIRHGADWRWLLKGSTTKWYPTMRLFRQEEPGDWLGVVECVCAELGIASLSTKPIWIPSR